MKDLKGLYTIVEGPTDVEILKVLLNFVDDWDNNWGVSRRVEQNVSDVFFDLFF